MRDGHSIEGLLQLVDLGCQGYRLGSPRLQGFNAALVLRVLGRRDQLRLLKLDLGSFGSLDTVIDRITCAERGKK